MNPIKSFLLLPLAILVFGCTKDKITGSGNVIAEERNITGFTGVAVNGSTKAFIHLDTAFSVTVKGYGNLLPYVETNVENGVLQVGFRNNVNVSNDNTELHLTLPILDYVQTNGIGDMTINGEVSGSDHLKASVNGSASINIEKG